MISLIWFIFAGEIQILIAKKRKSMEEATRAKETCPHFFDESILVAEELHASKDEIVATMKELMKCKDELHSLQAERTVYLKAALKMFQRGIVTGIASFLVGIHTKRSINNKQFFCGSSPVVGFRNSIKISKYKNTNKKK